MKKIIVALLLFGFFSSSAWADALSPFKISSLRAVRSGDCYYVVAIVTNESKQVKTNVILACDCFIGEQQRTAYFRIERLAPGETVAAKFECGKDKRVNGI